LLDVRFYKNLSFYGNFVFFEILDLFRGILRGIFKGIFKSKLIVFILGLTMLFGLFSNGSLFASDDDGVRSDCSVTESSSSRKIEEERKREEERRKESYPDKTEEEKAFEECLGGIYEDPSSGYPDFPKLPNLDNVIDKLCKTARREITGKVNLPSQGFLLGRTYGRNSVLPWNGILSQDIWNVLW
jgi:hypothetical protein